MTAAADEVLVGRCPAVVRARPCSVFYVYLIICYDAQQDKSHFFCHSLPLCGVCLLCALRVPLVHSQINHFRKKQRSCYRFLPLSRSGRTVGCIVLVLGVGRCAFRPPRVVFVLGLVSLINSLTSGKNLSSFVFVVHTMDAKATRHLRSGTEKNWWAPSPSRLADGTRPPCAGAVNGWSMY